MPPADVTGKPLELREIDLDRFLHPRSVAVIGASETHAKPNSAMTARLAAWAGANGADFFPVHPVYETVAGARCYRSIADVPGAVDLAVILTGQAVDTYEEVIAHKAKFAVIFAAGFSESGRDGERLEARLDQLVQAGETRLLGPNTNLNAFENFRDDLHGPAIALITQSGHQGRPVFQGQELGIRLSHWAPTGNEVDLEFADFAKYFADQPEVGVIAAYIEGFKDGRTLMLAAEHSVHLHKPIVVVKVGRTDEGASMAQAHTGHLTGSDAVVSAVFRQLGVTRVDGLDELLDTAAAFARTVPKAPPRWGPNGPGICVYAVSGGTGAHMADLVAAAGLRIPPLTKATQAALHDGLIPSYLRVSNPVDCGGPPVADRRGREILDRILADPAVDILIVPITGAVEMFSNPLTRDLVDVAHTTDKPIYVIWGAPAGTDDTYPRRLLDGGLPLFRTFSNCVGAVRAYVDYWQFVRRHRPAFANAPRVPSPAAARARRVLASAEPGAALSETASKAILKLYGIRVSRDRLCSTPAEAVRAAKALGAPVVMKIASPDLLHKSDLGLVRIGVDSDRAVRTVFDELTKTARRALGKRGRVDGVLVCEQVSGGVEMVVGVSRDELFGPVVMVGLGGVFGEVLGDVTFRVPPFGRNEAERMLHELAGFAMLEGVRGAKPADVDAFVDVIMNVQRLAMDLSSPEFTEQLGELDVNPLLVRSRGAVALDALVVRK
ncbi:MAG: acetate--CoA ligase family protein [Acidimicrobiia bacterium]|nr:acetate--CoA ligase family protein [Acidimicrobiia bacterium]